MGPLGKDRVSQTAFSIRPSYVSLIKKGFPRARLPAYSDFTQMRLSPSRLDKSQVPVSVSPYVGGRLTEELNLPVRQASLTRDLALLKPSPVRSHPWSFLVPACYFPRILEFQLASYSPTNGKGRGINMGLPLVGIKTVFLLLRR